MGEVGSGKWEGRLGADRELFFVSAFGEIGAVGAGDIASHAFRDSQEEEVDFLFVALRFEQDRAIGLVADKAGEGKRVGALGRRGAEADSLDPSLKANLHPHRGKAMGAGPGEISDVKG